MQIKIKNKLYKFQKTRSKHLQNKIFMQIMDIYCNDIYYISKKYEHSLCIDSSDIKSELLILLYTICSNYNLSNWKNEKKFRAYLLTSFHNWAWIKYNQKHHTLKNSNKTISIDKCLYNKKVGLSILDILVDTSSFKFVKRIEDLDIVSRLMNKIDKKYYIILKMIMRGNTYKEIADKYRLKKMFIRGDKAIIKYVPVSISCIKLIINRKIKPQLIKLYCIK